MNTSPDGAQPPRRSRKWPLIAGAALVVVGLGAGLVYLDPFSPDPAAEPRAAEEEPQAPAYAGDYLIGHTALVDYHGEWITTAAELGELWSEEIPGTAFEVDTVQQAPKDFSALLGEVQGARDTPYRIDALVAWNLVYHSALDGFGEFEDEPVEGIEDVRILGNIRPKAAVHFVVPADSGIHTIEDLAGRSIGLGYGSLPADTESAGRSVLEAAGLADRVTVVDPGHSDSLGYGLFQERRADAFLIVDELGAGEVANIDSLGHEARVLDLGDELAEKAAEDLPTDTPVTVAAGTYPGQDEELTLVTSWDTLYASPELDEELAYRLVEVMYEGLGEATYDDHVRVENALAGIDPDTLHPGARRYYEEQGLL